MPNEKDDFWDISSLLPPKKKPSVKPYGEVELPFVEPVTPQATKEEEAPEQLSMKLSRPIHPATEEKTSYEPKDNPLITRVSVYRKSAHMHIFHGFRAEGAALLKERGTPCPYVPYFSFVPQYNQLNQMQRAFYLYFRDEANAGNYLDVGQSYVLLYIFEIINLPEHIPPKIGVLRLAKVWAAYRDKMPAIDKYMIAWLADYALLHGVSCPRAILMPFLGDILQRAPLKEFYLGIGEEEKDGVTDALLLLTSNYKYQNSRYATGEHEALFHTHIRQAAAAVLRHVFLDGAQKPRYQTVKKKYEAFAGALWAGASRFELSVTYYSLTGTDDLRILMTAVVKYAENKLRAHLSVKSRLAVSCLPDVYRALLDTYFDAALPSPTKQAPPRPTYEALYDAPSEGVSRTEAAKIEEKSWENTWRLIPEEEKDEIFCAPSTEVAPTEPQAKPTVADNALTEEERTFLGFLLRGEESEARAFAKSCGVTYLLLGERINEYFADTLGDVVLELCGDAYLPIEDYFEEIRALL
ncbi:MAG: TerB N-terminal domain-containing protein [Clostridia bacterium]|nr:TerB N-terminal domain-containing protein [Clostridia bacterium]